MVGRIAHLGLHSPEPVTSFSEFTPGSLAALINFRHGPIEGKTNRYVLMKVMANFKAGSQATIRQLHDHATLTSDRTPI